MAFGIYTAVLVPGTLHARGPRPADPGRSTTGQWRAALDPRDAGPPDLRRNHEPLDHRRSLAVAAALTALSGVVASTSPALANDDDVVRRGSCTGSTDWKLKVGPEDGRLEVEGEVDSNRTGQTWRWRLVHNGSRLGARHPHHGGRERLVRGAPGDREPRGTDAFVFRAVNARTGEVCGGTVNY